jgi:hypothetical protein
MNDMRPTQLTDVHIFVLLRELKNMFERFLILRNIQRHFIINVHTSEHKVIVILTRFLMKFKFSQYIFKTTQISNFKENPPSGSPFVPRWWTDGRADRQTDMTKLMVAFRNFANAHN